MPSNKLYQLNFYTERELEQLGSNPSDMNTQNRGRKGAKNSGDSGEPKKTERISERLTDLVDNAVQRISKIQETK